MTATARRPTEAQLQAAIVQLAELLGYRVYHPWLSVKSAAGWPDLVLCHPGQKRLIFAEIKGPRGRLGSEQIAWLTDLRAAGCEAYLWTADHWFGGEVECVLKERP